MRHTIIIAVVAFGVSQSMAADVCKRPVNEIISETQKVIKVLKKQKCGYTVQNDKDKKNKRDLNLVTKTSHMLRQRHLCAMNKGDEVEAENLRKTAKNLLETFSTICAG